MSKKYKMFLVAIFGAAGTAIGTWGWIKFGGMQYVFTQLAGIFVFLEALLFLYNVRPAGWSVKKYISHIIFLIALGAATGILLFDIAGLVVFRLWEYPAYSPFSNPYGYLGVSITWGIYFLIFHKSYELLYYFLHRRHKHLPINEKIKKYFSYVSLVGLVLFGAGFAFPNLVGARALSGFMAFIGVWFILEGFELPRKRRTLLLETLTGNFRPWIAIVIGALIIGFLSEFANLNAPTQYWIYYGIPWENVTFMGVSLSLLLSWSSMYVIFLSLENILIRTGKNIWDNDLS